MRGAIRSFGSALEIEVSRLLHLTLVPRTLTRDDLAGLHLTERKRLFSAGRLANARARSRRPQAVELLESWRDHYLGGSEELLTRCLRGLGLHRRSVLPLLATATDSFNDHGFVRPRWATTLVEAISARGDPRAQDSDVVLPRFSAAFKPFAGWAKAQLKNQLSRLSRADVGLNIDAAAISRQFVEYLVARLKQQALRTIVLRLHAARLSGRLVAATPRARFTEFVRRELVDPGGLAALLADFPVLARVLATSTQQAVEVWCETLSRLARDWKAIHRTFSLPPARDRLVSFNARLGDLHGGGRSVTRLRFSSGWRLIYKPQPLGACSHFQELLVWLNGRGLNPPLQTLLSLDRGDYGWMECVEARSCTKRAQIEAFYQRLGSLLLILYLLEGVDAHLENLIAAGEHPVLVDLETLFHNTPRLRRGVWQPDAVRESVFRQLVTCTLLLPSRWVGTVGSVELSGAAGEGGQKTPFLVPRWLRENTDEMRLVLRRDELPATRNVPSLRGRLARIMHYQEAVIAGFERAYHVVLAHRDELAAPGGPLHAFRRDWVRQIVRPTQEYATLLQNSYHPSCLRDAAERDFLFSTLWAAEADSPYLTGVAPSERMDLWNGDVPLFLARVDGCAIVDNRGHRIGNFFGSSGLERVLDRLRRFGPADLARQLYCVRGSLATLPSKAKPKSRPSKLMPALCPEATAAELMAAAIRIGNRLSELAVMERGEAHWAGLLPLSDGNYSFAPVDTSLFSGTAGIALFLAYLARATHQPEFVKLARAAYRSVSHQLFSESSDPFLGAFQGVPSLLYASLHLAHVCDGCDQLADLRRVLASVGRCVRSDANFDVIGGAAGCAHVMLLFHQSDPKSAALDIADACGQHLLRNAMRRKRGIAWPAFSGSQPLLGFAHGAAGMAWVLFELAVATGSRRYREAGFRALAYERDYFDQKVGNWPDLRDRPRKRSNHHKPRYMWAWCHGAPGIGIARLASQRYVHDPRMREEVAAALASTAQSGFGRSHCLCHGDLGNIEFFQLAAEVLDDPSFRREALRRAKVVLDTGNCEQGWHCGAKGSAEVPGLMLGIAGIGYELTRLAQPDSIPSVLSLVGPRIARGAA